MRNVLLRKSLLFAGILCASVSSMAQVTQKWVQRENGDPNNPDVANDLAVDHNSNVIVTGFSQGKGAIGNDYATIKYTDDGNTKWVKRYNGPGNGNDVATADAVDGNGNVYVTGWSTGSGTGTDFATIKYDADGNTKWTKRFNGPANSSDQATAITVDEYGNVYVTGWSTGTGTGTDFTTIKYNTDGDTKWVKRFNGSANLGDQATAIAVDKNGNVYVTGWTNNTGTGEDYTTIKYDADGNQLWVQTYNGPVNNSDRANDLAVDDNGNVYVTGRITTVLDPDANLIDIATIKYNTAGVQQWAAIYNNNGRDVANAIAVDALGNVYITGFTGFSDEDSGNQYVTVKYNAAGMQQWAQTLGFPAGGGGEGGEANDLALDAAGNVYITGGLSIRGVQDYVTVKYNTAGVQQWVQVYDGPGNDTDIANAIGLDQYGNVYITGGSYISFNMPDYATLKYNSSGVRKWLQRYNGPGDQLLGGPDMANALALDAAGNPHVTGGITRLNTGLDYHTYKYETSDGDRIWKKTYSGPGIGPDVANDIAVDANGNVYTTGSSFGIGSLADIATVKYDKDGNSQWGKRYNGPGNSTDQGNAITVDNKGFVYVTGFSSNPGTSIVTNANADYTTIKYKDNGDVVWIKRYNGPGNFIDVANDIFVDANGNVYVTGQSSANGASTDYTTIKYDANGNQLWVARYNGPGNFTDNALALVVDASGNVYVTGSSYGTTTATDIATIKYNSAGVEQWVQRFGGISGDEGRDIGLDALGNVIVTGTQGSQFVTIKYSNAGVQQWAATHPGNGAANALAIDPNNNIYVTGGNSPGLGTPADYLTIKYNAAGVQQWEISYNGPGNGEDVAADISLDKDCNVYVTGTSVGNRTLTDYATIKYVQTPLITAREGTIPEQNTAVIEQGMAKLTVKAYPNAFTQYINLQWSGSDKPVAITITNAMGQLVEKRTGLAPSGTLRTGGNFGKGVYYAEIVQGTEKMLLKLIKN